MVQAVGGTAAIALTYAVVADIATSAERGKYMGYAGAGILMGPAFGSSTIPWMAIDILVPGYFFGCATCTLRLPVPRDVQEGGGQRLHSCQRR
jgi:MFS family permease